LVPSPLKVSQASSFFSFVESKPPLTLKLIMLAPPEILMNSALW